MFSNYFFFLANKLRVSKLSKEDLINEIPQRKLKRKKKRKKNLLKSNSEILNIILSQ